MISEPHQLPRSCIFYPSRLRPFKPF
jgi:hypothetical protein